MTLSSSHDLDRSLVLQAVELIMPLVSADEVAARWRDESALPGLTIGGLVRHLVSQPECAVEFLAIDGPDQEPLSLTTYFEGVDWLHAPVDAPENTSIRDDFNEMAAGGPADSVVVLTEATAALPAAIESAGPTTFVPWQGCTLRTEDFLMVRLMEIVVHADDLAVSLGVPTPTFPESVVQPVLGLLAALALRRNGQDAVLRTLARTERADQSVSAFG